MLASRQTLSGTHRGTHARFVFLFVFLPERLVRARLIVTTVLGLPSHTLQLSLVPDLGRILPAMKQTSPLCEVLRRMACSCLYGERFKRVRPNMRRIIQRYIDVEFELVSGRRNKRELLILWGVDQLLPGSRTL